MTFNEENINVTKKRQKKEDLTQKLKLRHTSPLFAPNASPYFRGEQNISLAGREINTNETANYPLLLTVTHYQIIKNPSIETYLNSLPELQNQCEVLCKRGYLEHKNNTYTPTRQGLHFYNFAKNVLDLKFD